MRSVTVGLVRAIVVGALAVGALACGGAQPSAAAPASAGTPAGAAKEPFDIEKAMAVEADDLSERGIKSPDGAWSTTALSAGDATVEPVDQDVLVNIPVAANAVVSCRVFDDTVDA